MARGPVLINEFTFFIGGKPHQILASDSGIPLRFDLVQLVQSPWSDEGLIRVKLTSGRIDEVFAFAQEMLASDGDALIPF